MDLARAQVTDAEILRYAWKTAVLRMTPAKNWSSELAEFPVSGLQPNQDRATRASPSDPSSMSARKGPSQGS
jgi:hypothetical protein